MDGLETGKKIFVIHYTEMRLKEGFELRSVCGEKVVLAKGLVQVDFNKMVHLNDTAAFLWEQAAKGEFTKESLVSALTENYEVSEELAAKDVDALLAKWQEIGIVEA